MLGVLVSALFKKLFLFILIAMDDMTEEEMQEFVLAYCYGNIAKTDFRYDHTTTLQKIQILQGSHSDCSLKAMPDDDILFLDASNYENEIRH